jgi:tetratricopeptide (TPR) repeat protein
MSRPFGYRSLLAASLLVFSSALFQAQSTGLSTPQVQIPSAFLPKAPVVVLNPSGDRTPSISPEMLGDVYLVRQRYQAAIDVYTKVAAPSAALWQKMGLAYQMLFDLQDATRCYNQSLQLNPKNPTVLNNLGAIYGSQKDLKSAERMYRESLRINPHDARVELNLGTTLLFEQKYKKGWEIYQKALALDPGLIQNLSGPQVDEPVAVRQLGATSYFRARGCARAGQTDCAMKYLRKAIDEGFVKPKKVAADNAFASLRANSSFQQLLAEE